MQRIFYEIYRDRPAFDSHENQPYMQRFVTERRACVLATNVIELRLKYAKVAPLPSSPRAAAAPSAPAPPPAPMPSPHMPPGPMPPGPMQRPQPLPAAGMERGLGRRVPLDRRALLGRHGPGRSRRPGLSILTSRATASGTTRPGMTSPVTTSLGTTSLVTISPGMTSRALTAIATTSGGLTSGRFRRVSPMAASAARITLLGRPGCHLCDDARAVIERVAADLGVGWEERDITQSPDDLREYWDKIPVTLVDGVQIDFWRVSEPRLRAALG